MKYHIKHTTTYTYSDPVPVCHNQLLLTPRSSVWLQCHSHSLDVLPAPATFGQRTDYFGNIVNVFSIDESLRSLTITSSSHVTVLPRALPANDQSPPWEQIVAGVADRTDRHWPTACEFTFDSPWIRRGDVFAEYARPSFPPGRPIMEAVADLTARIRKEFRYDTTVTQVTTSPEAAFKLKAGVCQDFAQVQIACLRSLGIPARYASGYLRTIPRPGKPRLVGADESHAWVSVYCGAACGAEAVSPMTTDAGLAVAHGHPAATNEGCTSACANRDCGWIEFDPTNNLICGTDHIAVAIGRDYQDIAPIRGVFIGGGSHTLKVSVDVAPEDEAPVSSTTSRSRRNAQPPTGR